MKFKLLKFIKVMSYVPTHDKPIFNIWKNISLYESQYDANNFNRKEHINRFKYSIVEYYNMSGNSKENYEGIATDISTNTTIEMRFNSYKDAENWLQSIHQQLMSRFYEKVNCEWLPEFNNFMQSQILI